MPTENQSATPALAEAIAEAKRLVEMIDGADQRFPFEYMKLCNAEKYAKALVAISSEKRTLNAAPQELASTVTSLGAGEAPAVAAPVDSHGGIAPSAMPRWIAVAERHPRHGIEVLFVTATGLWLGWRDVSVQSDVKWRDHFDDQVVCSDDAVTHWMTPPNLPDREVK